MKSFVLGGYTDKCIHIVEEDETAAD